MSAASPHWVEILLVLPGYLLLMGCVSYMLVDLWKQWRNRP